MTSQPIAGISRDRLATLTARETARFAASRPASAAAMARGAGVYLDGVPMHWMKDWSMPHLPVVAQAEGATITDIAG